MKKTCLLQVLVDIFIYLIATAGLYALWVYVEPFRSGFFCDDPSVKYPHKTMDVIPYQYMLAGSLGIPLLSVLISEAICLCATRGCSCRPYSANVCKVYGIFLFGALITMIMSEVAKIATGRPRPDFFAVCKPDMARINCAAGLVTKYNCTGGDVTPWELMDVHKSFPSAHASMSAYVGCFLLFYYQSRWKLRWSVFLKMLLQTVAVGGAMFVGLTRLSDHKHHAQDVFAGFLLGSFVGVWTIASNDKHLRFFRFKLTTSSSWPVSSDRLPNDYDHKGMHKPLYTR